MAKPAGFPDRCIFCGAVPRTKEHIIPAWMKDYLSPSETEHTVTLRHHYSDQIREIGRGMLHTKGDHRGKKLKVACAECNSGWMSALQNQAKPHLVRLILGDWSRPIDHASARTLAAWAVMYTMVYETAHPLTQATLQRERDYFKDRKIPPDRWWVWIGRCAEQVGITAPTWHRGFHVHPASQKFSASVTPKINTQTTALALGQAVLLTFSSRTAVNARCVQEAARNTGLAQIWPIYSHNQFVISRTIGPDALFGILDQITAALAK